MGLYFKFSIVLLYIVLTVIYIIKQLILKYNKTNKLKLFSIKRFIRYPKIILNSNVILVIIFFSIISNSIIFFQNKKYEILYNQKDISGEAVILSNKIEKQYNRIYKIKYQNNYYY